MSNSEMKSSLICKICNRKMAKRYNLKRHMKNVHASDMTSTRSCKIKCALCEEERRFPSRNHYEEHLQELHQIVVEKEELTFASNSQFRDWKASFEKETGAYFMSTTLISKLDSNSYQYFECNRSGFYSPKSKKLENSKRLYRKMNATCPARFKLKKNSELNRLEVTLWKTHVGHETTLTYQNTPKAIRAEIADLLKQKELRPREIIDMYKKRAIDERDERLSLISRNLLSNVQRELRLKTKEPKSPNNYFEVYFEDTTDSTESTASCRVSSMKNTLINLLDYVEFTFDEDHFKELYDTVVNKVNSFKNNNEK